MREAGEQLVMDRRVINCAEGRGHDTARSGQSSIQIWFVHLMNHLLREDRRRKEIDIDIYSGRNRWMALPAWKQGTVNSEMRDVSKAPSQQKRRAGTRKVSQRKNRGS